MKSTSIKIFIVCITVMLTLIVCEYLLRVIKPFTPEYLKKAPYAFSCYKQGSYYWLAYKRNQHCTLHSNVGAFSDVSFSLNGMGLRNPEIMMPKSVNTTRILLIGDSFMTGWGVSEQKSVPFRTGELLRAKTPSTTIETINAGLSASGQGYEYVFLKHEGMAIDPDIIIVGLYIHNDIADSLRESRWLGVNDQGLPDSIASSNSYVDFLGNVRRNTGSLKLKVPFLRISYMYDLVTDGILKLFPDRFASEGNIDLRCIYTHSCHTYDAQKQTIMKLFSGMSDLIKSKGKKLVVVLIPSELQVHPEHSHRYGISSKFTNTESMNPHEEFIQYFNSKGIGYVDLLPTFQEHASEPLYFTLDEHWNEWGNELAATIISSYLQDNGYVSKQ